MAIVQNHLVRGIVAVVAIFLAFAAAAAPLPPLDASSAELNKPLGPFRITDEIYFVGTRDLGIYFISTGEGAILIDGGFEQTVPQILANVRGEVFLGSHGGFYDLLHKREALLAGARTAFVDPAGCRRHIEAQEKAFRTMLAEQSH